MACPSRVLRRCSTMSRAPLCSTLVLVSLLENNVPMLRKTTIALVMAFIALSVPAYSFSGGNTLNGGGNQRSPNNTGSSLGSTDDSAKTQPGRLGGSVQTVVVTNGGASAGTGAPPEISRQAGVQSLGVGTMPVNTEPLAKLPVTKYPTRKLAYFEAIF